jgi:hypothetical protein
MKGLQDFRVLTRGGIGDLDRVVNTLALLDITPVALKVKRCSPGLTIDVRIAEDDRTSRLLANRLATMPAVLKTEIGPASRAAEPGLD